MKTRAILFLGVSALTLAACASDAEMRRDGPPASGLERIQHIVVIYDENRSFDNLYGMFPGANGVSNAAGEHAMQRDADGKILPRLPAVWAGKPPAADPAYRSDLPNAPFRIDAAGGYGMALNVKTRDLVHKFYQQQEQIDGGKLDRFAAVSDSGGLTMGHYDGAPLKMWQVAQHYTLADNFFMGAFGGSYLNHQWLICACTPEYKDAPEAMRAKLDAHGWLERALDSPRTLEGPPKWVNDGAVSPDGYSVNTTQSPYQPSGLPPSAADPRYADPASHPLPPQHLTTIGDTLSAKGISWAWYAGAWNAAVDDGARAMELRRVIYKSDNDAANFQPHHQPFNYFENFAPGTAARSEHLRDGDDFLRAVDAGTLPAVAFYKPQGNLNQHPGYANVAAGDDHAAELIARLEKSPQWASTVVIVTYDENGGFWDHVPPPHGDRWGPGSRIPTLIVSPFARRGFVDHTMYDTTSILKFITKRFDLAPLPGVRPAAGDLTNALALDAR